MPTPTPSVAHQFKSVGKLLWTGLINGALIGLLCLVVAMIDQKGTFTDFIIDNMTNIPLTVVLAGIVGGFGYVLQGDKTGFLATASKAWLDLIQQFFALGIGAFWFIQAAVWGRHEYMGSETDFHLGPALATFLGIVVMAFISAALDVAGSAPVTKANRIAGTFECIVTVLILFGLLRFYDGEAIKCAAGAELSRLFTGESKACGSFKLPTAPRPVDRASDPVAQPKR